MVEYILTGEFRRNENGYFLILVHFHNQSVLITELDRVDGGL